MEPSRLYCNVIVDSQSRPHNLILAEYEDWRSIVGWVRVITVMSRGFGGADDELALLHTPGADQGIGYLVHLVVSAPYDQHLQAAVLVDVYVQGGYDAIMIPVLQIHQAV